MRNKQISMIEIVNAQGAQVTNLQQSVTERDTVITLLMAKFAPDGIDFPPEDFKNAEKIKSIGWNQLRNGTLKVKVKK